MNRIRLLSEQVANQIAAGEVVERPASVVKELVENSIDAGASKITVEVQAGGRSLIRVTDDGFGMSKDDALMCLERHATSKIQRAEDLSAITSMGFRGEALPSIASISRFSLTTRERDSDSPEGTQIVVNGGKIVEVKAAGIAPGTAIEVRQIFFNLPARRKFLRAEETEAAHIQHYLTLAALAHPEVGFVYLKDGRVVWQLPTSHGISDEAGTAQRLKERMRVLLGGELQLIPVKYEAVLPATPAHELAPEETVEAETVRLWGFTGAPGVSRSTRDSQFVFVNRRPVENKGLNYALIEGYHTALMKGRFPVCCLFLEINPAEVDVNIHPSKREVKFHRERAVRDIVVSALRETLLRFHAPAASAVVPAARPNLPAGNPMAPVPPAKTHEQSEMLSPRVSIVPPTPIAPVAKSASAPAITRSAPPAPVPESRPSSSPTTEAPPAPASDLLPLLHIPLRIVGVLNRLYVLLESDRGLVLLDQHAAHERVLFEQMLRRMQEQEQASSQRLLLPETIELSVRDAQFVRGQLEVLTRLGVGLSEFGERTFLLDAIPACVKTREAKTFVIEIIDELKAAGQGINSMRLGEDIIAKTVCRHAVKANDLLAGPELEQLVADLRLCAMPYTCPHGRPTILEFSFRELEKRFGRQQ